ncbi:5'-3' exonuclease PLD3 isoform X1 [Brachyistius frenatus]|uniref:5'-3' exonuclease PLD3 isoform X1 n=1 Tax=Brachyistius frenatus TaxID=100188 RepID=UPI0037E7ECF1
MPMVLRARRSTATAAKHRRSVRRQGRANEESEESDTELEQSRVMEEQSPQAQPEEEAPEEADLTGLKLCSVVLDRLQADDNAAKKELEEKEDMNRKGGKTVSRIPTFHKRPSGTNQSTESPVPKKDPPVQVAQPPEKAATAEASKSKTAEARETALLLPSVQTSSVFSSTEQAAATARKSWSLSESFQFPLMTASPRPALRPERGAQHDKSQTSKAEADVIPEGPVGCLPKEGSLSQKLQDVTAEIYHTEVHGWTGRAASGGTERSSEIVHTDEISLVEAIMDEEPPWEAELVNIAELKDSGSSSDAECDDDLAGEKSSSPASGDMQENHEAPMSQTEFPNLEKKRASVDESSSPVTLAKMASTKSERSGCSRFLFFYFLPLLLLGGFGHHVWHYGLPMSVSHLVAQLELHRLEGFGLVPEPCSTDCRVHLVESIPAGLHLSSPSSRRSVTDSWLHLLNKANSSVHMAAFYLSLRDSDLELLESSDSQGRKVFEQLKQLTSKGVKLQIAVNAPQTSTQDTTELAAMGAEVREVDLMAVTGGIVHTKLWVVDQKHFYLGSANMDWRSLTQVKEVGLSVEDCSCLAQDAVRIFGMYWSIGGVNNGSLPPYWPARLSALSSSQNPLRLKFNGVPAQVYLSSAPPQISARGRSDDLSTILSVIDDAQKFIYISVMDYLPLSQFTDPVRFWPAIDSRLRAAACTRAVQVRLLVSCWEHSPASMFTFLQSLLVLNAPPLRCDVEVKIFNVPSTAEQMKIPFARVNHAKFMVTDRVLYIGTSNWSENYFTRTAGVGLVVNQTGSVVQQHQETLQSQAEELFLRDWKSAYASALSVADVHVCSRGCH